MKVSVKDCFVRQHVNIAFQNALASFMKKKIVSMGDACFRSLIIIKSHDLHTDDIKRVVGDIASWGLAWGLA